MNYFSSRLERTHLNLSKWNAMQRAGTLLAVCVAITLACLLANCPLGVQAVKGITPTMTNPHETMANAYRIGNGAATSIFGRGSTGFDNPASFANAFHGGGAGGNTMAMAATNAHSSSAMASTGPVNPFAPPPVSPVVVKPPPPPTVVATPSKTHLDLSKKLAWQKRQQELKQQEIDSLLANLIEIEGLNTDSMDQCSHWFDLNVRYHELTNNSQMPRKSEEKKKAECDELYKFFETTREKMNNFQKLAHDLGSQLEYVTAIVHEYLELKYAASVHLQLAQEFDSLVQSDEIVRKEIDQIESFLRYMSEALRSPEAEETVAEATAEEETEELPEKTIEEELRELDSILKDFIDKEGLLSPEELEELAELGGSLDKALSENLVPITSGRFHYLMGTLNAVRSIIVRKMVESGQKAREEAEEAARKEAEEEKAARKKAEEEEAAKKKAKEELARKKAEEEAKASLLNKIKPRFNKPPSPPSGGSLVSAQANGKTGNVSAAASGPSASSLAQTARTSAHAQTTRNSASAKAMSPVSGAASAYANTSH